MTIAFLDDHPLFIESMRLILSQQPQVDRVIIYSNSDDFLIDFKKRSFDILILDIMIPGTDGIKILEIIKKKNTQIKIIILTFIENIQLLKQSFHLGASGFLSKSCSIDEFLEALYTVSEGNKYVSKSLRKNFLNNSENNDLPVFHLTGREKDVLLLICKGFTIQQIANHLKITYYTAQYYNRNIMTKFKVKRAADLIVFAVLHGFYIPDIDVEEK